MSKKRETMKEVQPITDVQKNLLNSIKVYPMTIVIGPAGTGKTYITAKKAAECLKNKAVKKIVLTRPTVPTGRSIGYFPGNLQEKMDPWCRPIMDVLESSLGKGDLECQIKNGNIEVIPFETIRGRSLDNAFVILDEAQNCTYEEIKAFVTRIGENCTAVINGDISQSDLGKNGNGLSTLIHIKKTSKVLSKMVSLIEFTKKDIVRSGLCQAWVEEFEVFEKKPHNVNGYLV
jgi:phosphate starvation-inducible PhoH-like protein